MTEAVPDIPCLDFWPQGIPPHKLAAYQAMIHAGQITKRLALVNKNTGAVAVLYSSTIPQDWIRQEMVEIANECQQIKIEEVYHERMD